MRLPAGGCLRASAGRPRPGHLQRARPVGVSSGTRAAERDPGVSSGTRAAERGGSRRHPKISRAACGGEREDIFGAYAPLGWSNDKKLVTKPIASQTFLKKFFTVRTAFDILFLAPKSAAVRAVSSGVEHYLDTVGVTSSNLVSPTTNVTGHREVPVACFALLEDVGLNRSKHRRFATACLATRLAVLALERGRHVLIAFRCDELLVYIGNVAVRLIDRFEHLEHGISVQIKE